MGRGWVWGAGGRGGSQVMSELSVGGGEDGKGKSGQETWVE